MVQSPRERAIAHEQEFVDHAYEALDRQRASYAERLSSVRQQGGQESAGELTERDSFASHYEDNLIRLRNVENRLVLGRLDLEDSHVEHIGRIGLKDESGEILLLDWRAPQAEPFYRATAAKPGGVVRRRHIQTRFREVTGVEDELLDAAASVSDLNLTGEGALMAAMNQARDGKMSDIVATIQAEQDAIIRSDPQGVLVVQGGPGTGKTAVALHRAAYLLYSQRERLSRSGVLVVGPSPVFLRYIDQVLPALGESDVVSTTMATILPGITATAPETRVERGIKGRIIWRDIAQRAVRTLERPLPQSVSLTIDSVTVSLHPEDVAEGHRRARRTQLSHNESRDTYARYLVGVLARRIAEEKELSLDTAGWIVADVAASPDARREINLHWLPSSAASLLRRIFSRPALLAEVAPELSSDERAILSRAKDSGFTESDIPILDEIAELLGPFEDMATRHRLARSRAESAELARYAKDTMSAMNLGGGIVSSDMMAERAGLSSRADTLAERAGADRTWTYGHVIVDEAQELTPMQWEMLIRRCPTRSFTIVGDLDQYPAGSPPGGWATVLGRLSENLREEVLTVSYRTPGSILTAASLVMDHAGYPVRPVTAARELPHSMSIHASQEDRLLSDVPALVQEFCRALDREFGVGGGTIAVIVPTAMHAQVATVLADSKLLAEWNLDTAGTDVVSRIHVISAQMAKGLEYDIVVVVEPAAILEEGPGNLYVAMTRPTRHLSIVHARELPGGTAIWAPFAENAPIREG